MSAAGGREAVSAGSGPARSHGELLAASASVASALLARATDPPAGARVGLLVAPGPIFVASLLGVWRAGGVALPLGLSHPTPELERALRDADAAAVLASPGLAERVLPLCGPDGPALLDAAGIARRAPPPSAGPLPGARASDPALVLYTSGTTGRPKGVVHTHASLEAQIRSLVEAWEWSPEDRILHVLPLHHTHGLVNALLCALWAGAACEMLPGFEAEAVWERLEGGGITLFMGVPTLYVRLIAAWDAAPPAVRARRSAAARGLRLMVSGSAALPARVFARWREITGHALLERYGMTEIGMALSNPLRGERRPGSVGLPLPGVEVRLVDGAGRTVREEGREGELEVRGATVFRGYLGRPEETRAAFRHGWFRTGDIAAVEDGRWRILGRSSVDIVKTGGYKVSALEIEEVLREHPGVAECAVVGVPDPEWGETVCAAVVPAAVAAGAEALRAWAKERLAPYKVPRRWMFVPDLPRNAIGKVDKLGVRELFG